MLTWNTWEHRSGLPKCALLLQGSAVYFRCFDLELCGFKTVLLTQSVIFCFYRPGPPNENGRNYAFQEKNHVYFLSCHGINDVIELDLIKDRHRTLKNTKLPRKRGDNPRGKPQLENVCSDAIYQYTIKFLTSRVVCTLLKYT